MPMTMLQKAHHILRNLVIKEVSSVDRGAGEGVRVMLSKRASTISKAAEDYLKREFTDEQRKEAAAKGTAMPGGEYPIENKADLKNAIEAFGRAKDKAATKKHIITRAKALGASDELPDSWTIEKAVFVAALDPAIAKAFPDLPAESIGALVSAIAKDVGGGDPEEAVLFDDALQAKEITQEFQQEFWESTDTLRDSIVSILCDESADREKMIAQTLKEFSDHLAGILPSEMKKALAAGFAADAGGARTSGVEKMLTELAKKLGLPATATEAEIIKAIDEKEKKDKEAADKKVEKLAAPEIAYVLAKKFDAAGLESFQKMSAADRAKKMKDEPADEEGDDKAVAKALASGDAFKTETGVILHKRDYNSPAVFEFAKSQAAETADLKKKLAASGEVTEVADFAKRATELGFAGEFGETLRKAYKGDVVAIGKLETEIKALREQARVGKLFDESGRSTANGGKGYDQLMAKAKELMGVEKGLTIEQAFAKVYEAPASYGMADAVDLYKREKSSTAS